MLFQYIDLFFFFFFAIVALYSFFFFFESYSFNISSLIYVLFLFFSYEFILIDAEFLVLVTFIFFVFSLLQAVRGSVSSLLLDYSSTRMSHFFKFSSFFLKEVAVLGKNSWVSFFFNLSSFSSPYNVLQHVFNFFCVGLGFFFYVRMHFNFFSYAKVFFDLFLKVSGSKSDYLFHNLGLRLYNLRLAS